MLLQLCLLAAGIHFGRKLLKKQDEEQEPRPALREHRPPDAPAKEPGDAPAVPPLVVADPSALADPERSPRAAVPATGSPDAALQAADGAAQQQLNIALVSMGLTVTPGARMLGGLGLLYGSLPMMARAARRLGDGHVGTDLLESLSLIVSLAMRQPAYSALTFLLMSVAQKVRTRTEQEASASLRRLLAQRPHSAWVLRDGVEVSVPLGELSGEDVVVVEAGSLVPIDGVVFEGMARILGMGQPPARAPQPIEVFPGDPVSGMSLVLSGQIHLRVTASGSKTADCEVSRILQDTSDFAKSLETESEKVADDAARVMLAFTAVSSTLGATGRASALALLNNSAAGTMRPMLPISALNSLRTAYAQGILLKEGRALQQLAQVDTVLFSDAGALTELQVHTIHPARGVDEDALLRVAASAELRQHHPVARALLNEALRRGHLIAPSGEVHLEPGYGLSARQGPRLTRVGSRRFLESRGLRIPDTFLRRERASHQAGYSCVYVAQDRALLGLIELQPRVRPEAADILQALRDRDQCLYLLSGDHEAPTRALAEQLPIEHFAARLSPADKAHLIADLQRSGRRICFVGDGLSDALALKQAMVSVSLGNAAAAAQDSAQIILLDSQLHKLPQLFDLARESRRNQDQLFLASVVPAAVALGGVCLAGFRLNTVLLLELVSIVVSGALTAQTVPESGG